jgi:hypothetical protein
MLEVCGIREMGIRYWWGNLKERDHLEYLGVSGKVILNFGWRRLDLSGSGWGEVGGACEHDNAIHDS